MKWLLLSEPQDDILGRGFKVEVLNSCARVQLHMHCLRLVSRMLRHVLITHADLEGGWTLALVEECEVKYRHCLL